MYSVSKTYSDQDKYIEFLMKWIKKAYNSKKNKNNTAQDHIEH